MALQQQRQLPPIRQLPSTEEGLWGESMVRLERHIYRLEQELHLARACFQTLIETGPSHQPWSADDRRFSSLTPREKRVAMLLVDGYSNRRIAELLNVSVHTVKSQVSSVFNKLELRSRWQLTGLSGAPTKGAPLKKW